MNTPFDDRMRRVLEPFERDHDRLRAELMASLPADASEAPHRAPSAGWRFWTGFSPMERRILRIGILAAAAAIALTIFTLTPNRKSDGIAWADVVNRMERAKTLIIEGTSGSRVRHRDYMKDPSLRRTEEWTGGSTSQPASQPTGSEGPDNIEVIFPPETGWQKVSWQPLAKMAQRERVAVGCPDWSRSRQVTGMWSALRSISSDDTRKVGEASIRGEPTVVFETSKAAYLRAYQREMGAERSATLPEDQLQGTIRIYVHQKTASPLRIEVQSTATGSPVVEERADLQWDVPLDKKLFEVPTFDKSWTVTDIRHVCFSHQSWKAGNSFEVGPPGGPALVTEMDIQSIRSGTERMTNSSAKYLAMYVVVELKPEASHRFADYTRSHIGDKLVVSFNGRQLSEEPIYGEIRIVRLNPEPLDITLEEFEQRYLTSASTTSPPTSKGSSEGR